MFNVKGFSEQRKYTVFSRASAPVSMLFGILAFAGALAPASTVDMMYRKYSMPRRGNLYNKIRIWENYKGHRG